MKSFSFILTFALLFHSVIGANCTFTGLGDGSSWTDGSNWSCGSEPDPSADNVIIPVGFSVINDGGSDFAFDNGNDITINGSLDMANKKIELKASTCNITVNNSGILFNVSELTFSSGATGLFQDTASVTVANLKIDDGSVLTNNARCLNVTNKLENLGTAVINGTGCINYTGSPGDFVNSSPGGIYGCIDPDLVDCLPLSGGNFPLPIELKSFILENHFRGVKILWVSASEINNDYYSIERSVDGIFFEEVDRVDGAGNSYEAISYSIIDQKPKSGYNYYRLKQTDYDGDSETFEAKAIYVSATSYGNALVYPNPLTKDRLFFSLSEPRMPLITIEILSYEGKVIIERQLVVSKNETIHTDILQGQILSKGVYVVRINDGNEVESFKLIVQ